MKNCFRCSRCRFAAFAGGRRADDLTDGEVRKVDKDASKLTLKHGEIREPGDAADDDDLRRQGQGAAGAREG